jgi:hypothetical protein
MWVRSTVPKRPVDREPIRRADGQAAESLSDADAASDGAAIPRRRL